MQGATICPGITFAFPPALPVHRFSVHDYHELLRSGVLREDQRVELLDGFIVDKMPHNPAHDSLIDLVLGAFLALLPPAWFPRVQSAIDLLESEPEPDIAIVRGPRGRYAMHHPKPGDIGLLIEVAESSLLQDRTVKQALYARAAISFYWIVNIPDRCIEAHSRPNAALEKYDNIQSFSAGAEIDVILDGACGARFPINALFPN